MLTCSNVILISIPTYHAEWNGKWSVWQNVGTLRKYGPIIYFTLKTQSPSLMWLNCMETEKTYVFLWCVKQQHVLSWGVVTTVCIKNGKRHILMYLLFESLLLLLLLQTLYSRGNAFTISFLFAVYLFSRLVYFQVQLMNAIYYNYEFIYFTATCLNSSLHITKVAWQFNS